VESRRPGSSGGRRRTALRSVTRCGWALAALLCFGLPAGCTYTVSGNAPAAIEPPPPAFQPVVVYTVADFSFVLGGGDPAPSIFDGKQLSKEIMQSWQKQGYIRSEEYVADGAFSGTADYHLTLRGTQRGETSWTMQILNALSLSLIPYTITQRYELQYVLDDVHNGVQYGATIEASDKTWVEPLLIVTLPFAGRGHARTMQRVGDELYDQFRRAGAFTTGVTSCPVLSSPQRHTEITEGSL
jgi:hypothetical protein